MMGSGDDMMGSGMMGSGVVFDGMGNRSWGVSLNWGMVRDTFVFDIGDKAICMVGVICDNLCATIRESHSVFSCYDSMFILEIGQCNKFIPEIGECN